VVPLPSSPMKKWDSLARASWPGMPLMPERAGCRFRWAARLVVPHFCGGRLGGGGRDGSKEGEGRGLADWFVPM
jgi:hypothetical protein